MKITERYASHAFVFMAGTRKTDETVLATLPTAVVQATKAVLTCPTITTRTTTTRDFVSRLVAFRKQAVPSTEVSIRTVGAVTCCRVGATAVAWPVTTKVTNRI